MSPQQTITVALLQLKQGDDIDASIRTAAERGAELVVLSELHDHAYFCQVEDPANFDLAEPIPGPSCEHYSALAKKHGVVLITSLFEKRSAGLFHNTAVVFETNGEMVGRYRKMHIPDDPGYYEKYYFTPGDLGFTPVKTSLGNIGLLICWDQWFPEAARLMALAGADLLVYPTAIGWDPDDQPEEKQRQLDAWKTIQRSHAIANNLPVIACNRTGFEKDPSHNTSGIEFWGNSFVCGQQGESLAEANATDSVVLTAQINFSRTEDVRRIWPYLRDRRIDSYDGISRRFIDTPPEETKS